MSLRRRVWAAVENSFEAHDLATSAQAALGRARVRDRQAVTTEDRIFHWYCADASFSGEFEQLRHWDFAPPFLRPSFVKSSPTRESTLCFRQHTIPEPIDAGSHDDEFFVTSTEDFGDDQLWRCPPAHGAFSNAHWIDVKTRRDKQVTNPIPLGFLFERFLRGTFLSDMAYRNAAT